MSLEYNSVRVYGRSVRNEDIHWECSTPDEATLTGIFYIDKEFASKTPCSRCGKLLIEEPSKE